VGSLNNVLSSSPLNGNVGYNNSWITVNNDQNRNLFANATYVTNFDDLVYSFFEELSSQLNPYSDFGSVGNLSFGLSSTYSVLNTGGYSSVGFCLTPPMSGSVEFQGSFDGINFIPITMRSISDNGYTQQTNHHSDNYIGSIATLRSFRFVTQEEGLSVGTVMGRASREVCTLEGIENNAAPHKIGNIIVSKDFEFNTTHVLSAVLWQPTPNRKFVVTDLIFGASNGVDITFFDEISTNGNVVYKTTFVGNGNNQGGTQVCNFSIPYESREKDNKLKLLTSGSTTIKGVIHGYETF
jgi:hypothetical protein